MKIEELRRLIREELNNPYDNPSRKVIIQLDLSNYERNQLESLLEVLKILGKENDSKTTLVIEDYINQNW